MVLWCSYCQRYLGEKEPFDDLAITHGMCDDCLASDMSSSKGGIARGKELRGFYAEIAEKALSGRPLDCPSVIAAGRQQAIQDDDLLMGIVQPILYRVGQEYAAGRLSIATEHAFTIFVEELLHALGPVQRPDPILAHEQPVQTLLVSAEGNYHSLGLRFVNLFIGRRTPSVLAIYPGLPAEEIAQLVTIYHPRNLGVSICMPQQLPEIRKIHAALADLSPDLQPQQTVIGGQAVRDEVLGQLPRGFIAAPRDYKGILSIFRAA